MLYATRLVRTGVERAYGEVLRLKLRRTMNRPAMAVLVGAALAMAFQSSMASPFSFPPSPGRASWVA